MGDVLLVLADAGLHDDLARCSAAAGYTMVVGDAARCRHQWLRAAAVAADGQALDALTGIGLPSRDGLFAVGAVGVDGGLWRSGLLLGADGGFVLRTRKTRWSRRCPGARAPAASCRGRGGHVPGTAGPAPAHWPRRWRWWLPRQRGYCCSTSIRGEPEPIYCSGWRPEPGLRWSDVKGETGAIGGTALRAAVPRSRGVGVLTGSHGDAGPLRTETVMAVLNAARGAGDVVVADLGREPGPVTEGVAVSSSVDLTVVVTTATVPAVAATRRTVARMLRDREPLLLVRGPSPSGLRAEQVAASVGLPLLYGYRPDPGLPARCEAGGLTMRRRSPLARAAGAVCDRVLGQRTSGDRR